MMSMQSSTHSSQMKTVGPAISLRTSCWLLPQNEQYNVFFESLVPTLLILVSVRRSPSVRAHDCRRPNEPLEDRSKFRTKKGRSTRRPPRFVTYYISLILAGLPKRICYLNDNQDLANGEMPNPQPW